MTSTATYRATAADHQVTVISRDTDAGTAMVELNGSRIRVSLDRVLPVDAYDPGRAARERSAYLDRMQELLIAQHGETLGYRLWAKLL